MCSAPRASDTLPKCDYRVVVHYLTMSIATSIHMHNLFFLGNLCGRTCLHTAKAQPKMKIDNSI